MNSDMKAVITGASSGIGRAIAIAIAATGSSVCLVGRDSVRLEAVAKVARKTSRTVIVHETDLSVDTAIESLAHRITHEFTTLDVLVHCAGAYWRGHLEDTPVKQHAVQDKRPRAILVDPGVAALPEGQARSDCFCQLVSRPSRPQANTAPYAAIKHALKGLADSLRDEVNTDGVRVLSIYPGRTATPLVKALFELEGRPYRPEVLLQTEDIAQTVLNALLLARTAEITNLEIRAGFKSN